MLSECARLFCVIFVLEYGFLVRKVVGFSFTLDWFRFLHFFSSTGKKKTEAIAIISSLKCMNEIR